MKKIIKTKVLCFIDWYRPGYKAGGTITAFGNFVDHLESEFEFVIVTRNIDYLESIHYKDIMPNELFKKGNVSYIYLSHSDISFFNIKKVINTTFYNYLYINGMFSFYFSILPVLLSKSKNIIVNPHGMLSNQAFSVKKKKKSLYLIFLNFFNLYKNISFHVANKKEAFDVNKRIRIFKEIKIADQFPRKLKSKENRFIKGKNEVTKFISVTRISVEKGTLYLIKALRSFNKPLILNIYGPIYDLDYWNICQKEISCLPSNVKVRYKGVLTSDQVLEVLNSYDFFVLLTEGENFGHAILEAFSAGCPVIISDQTPWRDLQEKGIGWDIPLDQPDQFIKAIETAAAMDQENYIRMSQAAFEFAKAFTRNPEVLEANRRLFGI